MPKLNHFFKGRGLGFFFKLLHQYFYKISKKYIFLCLCIFSNLIIPQSMLYSILSSSPLFALLLSIAVPLCAVLNSYSTPLNALLSSLSTPLYALAHSMLYSALCYGLTSNCSGYLVQLECLARLQFSRFSAGSPFN